MPNPKASSSTQGYRQSIKSKDAAGNVITTTNFETNQVRQGSVQQARSSSGGGGSTGVGNPVELFIVGALFVWLVESGKLKAIIDAATT